MAAFALFIGCYVFLYKHFIPILEQESARHLWFNQYDFQLSDFDDAEEIELRLTKLMPVGAAKSDIDLLLLSSNLAFRTDEYFLDENLRTHPRRERENYLVIYYILDYRNKGNDVWPWQGPSGWEIWSTFSSQDALVKFEAKRRYGKSGIVQHTLLPNTKFYKTILNKESEK